MHWERFAEIERLIKVAGNELAHLQTLAQYAGRLNRARPGRREVMICDYADLEVPILNRMLQRRMRGYRQIGYTIHDEQGHLPV